MTTDVRTAVEATRRIFSFDNSYARLPAPFQLPQRPAMVSAPKLIAFNRSLAAELGLDLEGASEERLAAIFAGQELVDGAQPLAMAYAGHQFGQFVPQLGDGRAILLGEVIDRKGQRRDIQLKGGGPTPFSRRGDGRAALGPVLREYIVSEAMAAFGIPTTRALAAVTTGDPVYRETMLPGAVFTRVASSHIRVGTFQFFAARSDHEGLRRLADYVIARHYPGLEAQENPYLALLRAIVARQAALIAHWMAVGFIHGVMNTDNMTVSGETIDFGPCAFMDAYDPAKVFSSIDQNGRYAYRNQPAVGQWNLARLAEAMLPILDSDIDAAVEMANGAVIDFAHLYQTAWLQRMGAKIGLSNAEEADRALIEGLLDAMAQSGADFTLTFRALCDAAEGDDAAVRACFADPAAFDAWAALWRERLARDAQMPAARVDAMRRANPYIIPRNHRIEQAIVAAVANGDFAPFERMVEAVAKPYETRDSFSEYTTPPQADEVVLRTFCGT